MAGIAVERPSQAGWSASCSSGAILSQTPRFVGEKPARAVTGLTVFGIAPTNRALLKFWLLPTKSAAGHCSDRRVRSVYAKGRGKMISRVFVLANEYRAALERLGAALVLQWSNVPAGLRDALVQQAVSLDWGSDPEAAAHRIAKMVATNGSAPPADGAAI